MTLMHTNSPKRNDAQASHAYSNKPTNIVGGRLGLSVIVQHYNRPWLMEITVLSLKRQLERENVAHEFIVADDGSDPSVLNYFDALPLDALVVSDRRIAGQRESSVYETLEAAINRARYPCVLFVQDDFWLIPQGFSDYGKCHLHGLRIKPDFQSSLRPLSGAALLLRQNAKAHFVELARSFNNARYDCLACTESHFGGLAFRAKRQDSHVRFYSCDWPHVQRTAEMRRTPLPKGMAIWPGETRLEATRRDLFGPSDWVYNSSHCFFIHVNVFTWRACYKRGLHDTALQWTDVTEDQRTHLPFDKPTDIQTNIRLLAAFANGRIKNDFEAYCDMSPLEYIRSYFAAPLGVH